MKKEMKILGIVLISLMLAITILGTVIANGDSPSVTDVTKKAGQSAVDTFNKIFGVTLTGEGIWELSVVKFLLMFLIFAIVYGVADIIIIHAGTGAVALKIIFSIVVAYISVAYLATAEIYAALVGWGAMAVTITAIIPFVVILALSWRLVSNPDPAKMLIQKLLLGIFSVYLVYRVAALIWFRSEIPDAWKFALPIYITMLAVTVSMTILSATIRRFLFTTKAAHYIEIAETINKEEALANSIRLRELATKLEETGAKDEAARLRTAATNLEKVARRKLE